MAGDSIARFWSKVARADCDGCWHWTAGRTGFGYGQFGYPTTGPTARNRLAHRFSYELVVGPIPQGFTLDHLCRNPGCVNPSHLEVVTMRENLRRGNGWAGRNARKTHCPQGHALTPDNLRKSELPDRCCRTCHVLRQRAYVARQREMQSNG